MIKMWGLIHNGADTPSLFSDNQTNPPRLGSHRWFTELNSLSHP